MAKEISFVCVENAGRSQIAEAIARKIAERKDMDIEITSGGTKPIEDIHDNVKVVLEQKSLLKDDMEPKKISLKELKEKDYVVTMGCDLKKGCPATLSLETVDWGISNPKDREKEEVKEITEEIEKKVEDLLEGI